MQQITNYSRYETYSGANVCVDTYTEWHKKVIHRVFVTTASNMDRFKTLNSKMCSKVNIKDPATSRTLHNNTLWNVTTFLNANVSQGKSSKVIRVWWLLYIRQLLTIFFWVCHSASERIVKIGQRWMTDMKLRNFVVYFFGPPCTHRNKLLIFEPGPSDNFTALQNSSHQPCFCHCLLSTSWWEIQPPRWEPFLVAVSRYKHHLLSKCLFVFFLSLHLLRLL